MASKTKEERVFDKTVDAALAAETPSRMAAAASASAAAAAAAAAGPGERAGEAKGC